MTKVYVDTDGQVKLDELREPAEVCATDGRTLGVFCPTASPATPSPYSIEELEKLRKERNGKTLAQIKEDLKKQGIEL